MSERVRRGASLRDEGGLTAKTYILLPSLEKGPSTEASVSE